MSWTERSAANLLPLSEERSSLKVALREWVYSGETYDLIQPVETCELCEHPDIRYQFKIVNKLNGSELLVGSECITKFGILAVGESGEFLNQAESRRKVHQDRRFLIEKGRRKRLVEI